MTDMNRRDVLGSIALIASGAFTLPALAARIEQEPPPETELRFPVDPIPRPVNSIRQIINLRYVTTYVSLFIDDSPEIALDQRKLQLSVNMSTRHRKGFGIPIDLVSAKVKVGRVVWNTALESASLWDAPGYRYASALNGPSVPSASYGNVTLNYLVKGRKKSLAFKNILVFSPLIVPG